MKKVAFLCLSTVLISAACSFSKPAPNSPIDKTTKPGNISSSWGDSGSNSSNTVSNPVPSQISGPSYTDPLNGIVINRDDWQYVPGKYTCGGYTLTKPDFTENAAKDVVLEPGGRLILSPGSDSPYQYDVTFSKDCQHVYSEQVLPGAGTRIQVVDVQTGTTSSFSIPDSVYPDALVMQFGNQTYFPTLSVLYAIDANDLLLWFENPTTGLDAYTNQSSQAVYNLTTHKVTFVSLGGGSPPVLLDYKTNTLIVAGDENSDGDVISLMETDLQTGQESTSVLTKPYEYTLPCDRSEFDDLSSYVTCRNEWLAQLLN